MREYRLYQASFLLRDYGWDLESLPFEREGFLPLDQDPKQAWAKQHLTDAPVEINRASREDLLRVPGVGPKGADAILKARRSGKLTDASHLRSIGVRPDPLLPYVLLNGRRPPQQLSLL
jgi:predicted DNA-binding helix-hairpin-helix protein